MYLKEAGFPEYVIEAMNKKKIYTLGSWQGGCRGNTMITAWYVSCSTVLPENAAR